MTVTVSNIYWLSNGGDRPCTLELDTRTSTLKVTMTIRIVGNEPISLVVDDLANLKTQYYLERKQISIIWGTQYKMFSAINETQAKTIQSFFKSALEMCNYTRRTVENLARKLSKNTEVYNLVMSFLNKGRIGLVVFPDYIATVEQFIAANTGYIGGLSIWLPIEKLNEPIIGDHTVDKFISEDIPMLIKVLGQDGYLPEDMGEGLCWLVVWRTIRLVAVEANSMVIETLHQQFFEGTNFSIPDIVKRATQIDEFVETPMSFAAMLTYYRMKHTHSDAFFETYSQIAEQIRLVLEEKKLQDFKESLTRPTPTISIDDVDLMTGKEFEQLVADIFIQMGYSVTMTPVTGDQGVDIIAKKKGRELGIQGKRYTGTVSNAAVQEVVAGLRFYGLEKGLVVTNSFFTQSAIDLAEANNVILWDRSMLGEKLGLLN